MTTPQNFDLIVIGGGPGGYVAAIRAAQLGATVACIEARPLLGGTCLNVGCIPSKTLLHATELLHKLQHDGKRLGVEASNITANFETMMARKEKVLSGLGGGVASLFKKHKITRIEGKARLLAPGQVAVGDEQFSATHIVLATGSDSAALPFLPFDERRVLSSTGALSLKTVPKSLVVVGAGVIGLELGSVYRRLGAEVTFVEFLDRVCPVVDRDLSKALGPIMEKQGLSFHLSCKVVEGQVGEAGVSLNVERLKDGERFTLSTEAVLVSIGRRPYTQGLGLDTVGIAPDSAGRIPVDGSLRTSVPGIYAIGDVVDGPMLAHKASEEGVAIAESLFSDRVPHINYMAIPNVIYTWPEVATVGLFEEEAVAAGLKVRVGRFPMRANSRAHCTGDTDGLVKVVAEETTGRIVGLHIVAANAGELIHEGVALIEKGATLEEVAAMSHAHPTISEAIHEAALVALDRPINI